ncbi:peptidylprolyl isomerase [Streptomyces sp. NPDC005438]|uniref:peptidylprolyl isomerase n=1 Tax=Streptomyces sp. NPDC005438 TaxID=3156880 RepID=UPI0033B0C062
MVSNEQRRKQLAREKYQRQLERRAAQRRKGRVRNALIAGGLVLVLAAGAAYAASGGLNGDEEGKDSAKPSTPPSPSKAPDPCDKPAKGKPNGKQWKKEPAMKIDKSADYTMKMATTCGDINIRMEADKAPHTVNSFAFLAGQKFFDHSRCHRLVEQGIYVLQCGDPKGTGQGGPGYTIPDENLKDPRLKKKVYPAGTVAMANRYNPQTKKGRDSGGSQFFLVYKDSQLPPDYTPFGTMDAAGMKVLKKIAKAGSTMDPTTQNTPPNATVVIDKATVSKS